jgi:hypothetical protein
MIGSAEGGLLAWLPKGGWRPITTLAQGRHLYETFPGHSMLSSAEGAFLTR